MKIYPQPIPLAVICAECYRGGSRYSCSACAGTYLDPIPLCELLAHDKDQEWKANGREMRLRKEER